MPKRQSCTVCGKPSIPGLKKGKGKCQYHWDVGAFGQEWADKVRKEAEDFMKGAKPCI